MTPDAPTTPTVALGDRVRVTREGVVRAFFPGGYDFVTDTGDHFGVSDRFPAEVEVLTPPASLLFVDGDLVASTTTEGERVLRIRKGGQWFFVNGPTTGARSWLLDRELEAHVDAGSMWRVDTDQPTAVEPFAFDAEGHEVGKTYTNRFGAHFKLRPDHRWDCTKTNGMSAAFVGNTLDNDYPERPLTEVTT